MEQNTPIGRAGDLVIMTESRNIPTMVSTDCGPVHACVPIGTMGVITADKGSGIYSVITGLGLISVHTRYLRRLGLSLHERMDVNT